MRNGRALATGTMRVRRKLNDRLFARIQNLFDIDAFSNLHVLVAGTGSGGSQVALQLALSGVQNFSLVDNDVLEDENVIRHVCGIRYLGQHKVDALSDVLLDRNPNIQIRPHHEDIETWDGLGAEVQQTDVVVLATDNEVTRYQLNQLCVDNQTPFVVGRVFTRGIGGEVFAYRPGAGGCLACLEDFLERGTNYRQGIREIDLIPEEERDERMYGLNAEEIKDSPGLAIDIAFITSFHARFVLDALGDAAAERPKFLVPIDENYVVWGNRPVYPFDKHFQIQRIKLPVMEGCKVCGGKNEI